MTQPTQTARTSSHGVPLLKLPGKKNRLSIHLSPCYACVRAPRRVRDRLRMPAGRAQPLHSQSPSTLPANPTQVAWNARLHLPSQRRMHPSSSPPPQSTHGSVRTIVGGRFWVPVRLGCFWQLSGPFARAGGAWRDRTCVRFNLNTMWGTHGARYARRWLCAVDSETAVDAGGLTCRNGVLTRGCAISPPPPSIVSQLSYSINGRARHSRVRAYTLPLRRVDTEERKRETRPAARPAFLGQLPPAARLAVLRAS